MKFVEGTDVRHCDKCGKTDGDPTADGPKADVVPLDKAASDAAQARAKAELNAATQEALMGVEPIPSRDQFLTMAATANMLSQSTAAPPAMRDPYVAFHVCMMGRALNLDPATAMNLIDPIGYDKKKSADKQQLQLSLSPELLVARVEMLGLGSVELLWATKTRAEAVALLPKGRVVRASKNQGDVKIGDVIEIIGEKGRVEFDWDMANDAELVDDRCIWDQASDTVTHWKRANTNGRGWSGDQPNGCRCGSYKKHPGRMMGWRAMGFCVHTYFAQASLGLYSPEELGAVVDDNGRAIDPMTVELPEGYTSAVHEPAPPPRARALPEQIVQIKARIATLGDKGKAELRTRWDELGHKGLLNKVDELWADQVATVTSMLLSVERLVDANGWNRVASQEAEDGGQAGLPRGTTREAASEATEASPPDPATEPDPDPVEDPDLELAIAQVRDMTVRKLNAECRARDFKVEGVDEATRRRSLAYALYREISAAKEQTKAGEVAQATEEAQDEGGYGFSEEPF